MTLDVDEHQKRVPAENRTDVVRATVAADAAAAAAAASAQDAETGKIAAIAGSC